MKHSMTWILIADGAEARVYAHEGPGKGLQLVDGLQFHQAHLQAQEIMADRPGRSISSVGSGRSAVEYSTDPVKAREQRFVEHVAEVLDHKHQSGAFQRLIIAAAPIALGQIRPALSKGVQDTVIAELPKDLTKIPTAQLAQHFEAVLAV